MFYTFISSGVSLTLAIKYDVTLDWFKFSALYKIPGCCQQNLGYHTDRTWFLIMTKTVKNYFSQNKWTNFKQFIHNFDPDIQNLTWKLEKCNKNLNRQALTVEFCCLNITCIWKINFRTFAIIKIKDLFYCNFKFLCSILIINK